MRAVCGFFACKSVTKTSKAFSVFIIKSRESAAKIISPKIIKKEVVKSTIFATDKIDKFPNLGMTYVKL